MHYILNLLRAEFSPTPAHTPIAISIFFQSLGFFHFFLFILYFIFFPSCNFFVNITTYITKYIILSNFSFFYLLLKLLFIFSCVIRHLIIIKGLYCRPFYFTWGHLSTFPARLSKLCLIQVFTLLKLCRTFNSDNALQSHTKAKHEGKWMIDYARRRSTLASEWVFNFVVFYVGTRLMISW